MRTIRCRYCAYALPACLSRLWTRLHAHVAAEHRALRRLELSQRRPQ